MALNCPGLNVIPADIVHEADALSNVSQEAADNKAKAIAAGKALREALAVVQRYRCPSACNTVPSHFISRLEASPYSGPFLDAMGQPTIYKSHAIAEATVHILCTPIPVAPPPVLPPVRPPFTWPSREDMIDLIYRSAWRALLDQGDDDDFDYEGW